jgi:hypothetical protein
MSIVIWQVIAIAVVVIGLVGYFAIGPGRFGPEDDQTVEATGDEREPEPELDAGQEVSPVPTARRR